MGDEAGDLELIIGRFILDGARLKEIGEPIVQPGMPITYSKDGEEFKGFVENVFLILGTIWKIITQDKKITHPANIRWNGASGVRTDVNVGDEYQICAYHGDAAENIRAEVIGNSSLGKDSTTYLKDANNGDLYTASTALLAKAKLLSKLKK